MTPGFFYDPVYTLFITPPTPPSETREPLMGLEPATCNKPRRGNNKVFRYPLSRYFPHSLGMAATDMGECGLRYTGLNTYLIRRNVVIIKKILKPFL